MHQFMYLLLLLGQRNRVLRGLAFVKWGMTIAGVSILFTAVILVTSTAIYPETKLSLVMTLVASDVFLALGCGMIVYAWRFFEKSEMNYEWARIRSGKREWMRMNANKKIIFKF